MSKIYLLKYGERDAVFTRDKNLAKLYKKQRGKDVDMITVSDKKFPDGYLEKQSMRELTLYGEYAMTEDEYLYFEESFGQWMSESSGDVEHFVEHLTLMRFTKEESDILKPLMRILGEYMHDCEHGTIYEGEVCYEEYFDYNNAIKFFIDNIA